MADKKKTGKEMSYSGKSLVRCGNMIYLGDLSASHFAMLQVLSFGKEQDVDVPQKIAVQLIANDPALSPKDKVVKRAMKDSLYGAMNIANVWIEQYVQE